MGEVVSGGVAVWEMVVVRNRTSLFVRFREEARRLSTTSGVGARVSALDDVELLDLDRKPAFVELHERLGAQLLIVDRRLKKLSDLHSKRLLPVSITTPPHHS